MTSLRQGLTAAPGNRAPCCGERDTKVPLPFSRQGLWAQGYFWRGGVESHDREKPQLEVGWRKPADRPHQADDKVTPVLEC
jgi:hypothetical protein